MILQAENISKSFSGHTALSDINISIPHGSVYGLLGPNGAGKTTLIRIINQILAPDSGRIFFKGKLLKQDDIIKIGYLPEERGLYKKMKVGEQALYLARLKGISKGDAMQKLKYWFEKFEIQSWWDKKIEELSKGMQQKVQFVTTVLHEPELLIFDEPFSGFDPINANMIKNEILELKEKGTTIIFSTHNMASVEELCDYITLINKSHNILNGQVDEIKAQYKSGVYNIIFEGDPELFKISLNNTFELLELKPNHVSFSATLKIRNSVADNELLKILIPVVHVKSYVEVLPSMNEIFIKLVNESGKSSQ